MFACEVKNEEGTENNSTLKQKHCQPIQILNYFAVNCCKIIIEIFVIPLASFAKATFTLPKGDFHIKKDEFARHKFEKKP